MNLHPHSRTRRRRASIGGFSLMEITLAFAMSMMVASGTLMLLSMHTNYMQQMESFRFLRDEAPQVNALVTQMVEKSAAYRIHANRADVFSEAGAVNTGGKAVRLQFRNPSGLIDQSAIVFETVGGFGQLNYYRQKNGVWPTTADWTITSDLLDAQFSDDTGVLLMTLTGPKSERVTYSGTSQ